MSGLSVSPNKRAVSALRVIEELPAWLALGPNGQAVAAFIERCKTMTPNQKRKLSAALHMDRDAALSAALDAALDATSFAALSAARDAALSAVRHAAPFADRFAALYAARYAGLSVALYAAQAIVVRGLITADQYAVIVQPFVDAGLREWVI